jgi:hypothetical protein
LLSVLVTLDGSARLRAFFDAALKIAVRFDLSPDLFRAVAVAREFSAAGHMLPGPLPEIFELATRTFLERLAAGSRGVGLSRLRRRRLSPFKADGPHHRYKRTVSSSMSVAKANDERAAKSAIEPASTAENDSTGVYLRGAEHA